MWIWDPQLSSIQYCNLFLWVLWLGILVKFLRPFFKNFNIFLIQYILITLSFGSLHPAPLLPFQIPAPEKACHSWLHPRRGHLKPPPYSFPSCFSLLPMGPPGNALFSLNLDLIRPYLIHCIGGETQYLDTETFPFPPSLAPPRSSSYPTT